jgi:hypothetical protein
VDKWGGSYEFIYIFIQNNLIKIFYNNYIIYNYYNI